MRLNARLLPSFVWLAWLALPGCAAGGDATEKQLAELRAEVTKLRAGQAALGERVDGLEIDRGAFGKPAASAAPAIAPAGSGADRPELSVVRLSPSEGDGDVDNGAPRPVIRAVGNDGSIQKGKRDSKKGAAGAPKKADPDARPTVKP